MQGDTAIQCVFLLPRDLDRWRRMADLDLALRLPLSREKDLGCLLAGDPCLSPRFQDLLEELELDLVTDLLLSEADLDLETLLDPGASLRFSDDSLASLILSSPFGLRATSTDGKGWVFFSSW